MMIFFFVLSVESLIKIRSSSFDNGVMVHFLSFAFARSSSIMEMKLFNAFSSSLSFKVIPKE